MNRIITLLLLLVLSWQSHANAADTDAGVSPNEQLATLIAKLPKTKLRSMASVIDEIAAVKNPQTKFVLQSMLDGDLYYIKSNRTIVQAIKNDSKLYQLTDVMTNESLDPVKKSVISKIRTNNSLRSKLRSLLARIDLTDPNKAVRLQAVQQLLSSPNKGSVGIIEELVEAEQANEVKQVMTTILALDKLKSGDHSEKMQALTLLESTLEPVANNVISNLLASLPEKERTAEQQELAAALNDVLGTIESKRSFYSVVENVFFGLSLGSVLLLAAIGLAITFGVMGVINMAHGELIMLGAYTTYVIQLAFPELIEYSLLIALPAAFIVSGSVGILIERGVIRFLKGRPLETLLATFGISLILQQLVRTVFSPLNRQVISPEWMSGSWQINPIFSLTFNRLYIILFAIVVFVSLVMILKKSSLGLHVRAVSQNRDMARALSIKSDWVDAITFGLGSGIAGIAGVVLSQLTNVGPNLGQAYIIDSFLVVVFGGVGNLWGTLVAAMTLGLTNKFLEPITGSVLASIIVLVGLVLFIQKRPKGLFPQKGRAAD